MSPDRPAQARRAGAFVALGAVVVVAALALLAAACGGSTSASTTSSPGAAGPITVTDDSGHQVTLTAPAQRVVSLAPANTEIAYAIGAGDKMVAGTVYDDYPAAAKKLPKVGDFANPSVEKIVAFRPDLVLAAGGIQASLRSKLENLGVKVFVVDPTSLSGVFSDLTKLGKLMGVSAKADAVTAALRQRTAAIEQKVAGLPTQSVFVEIYSKPLMTAGTGTYVADMVKLAGGTNIGDAAGSGFPTFSEEVLFKDDPDVYIATTGSMVTPGQIAKRKGYSALKAVQDDRVYVLDQNILDRPGPRLVDGLEQLARAIHPEAFGSPSPSPVASSS
jgi:iron complex transport system substrate-binding protein